MIFGAVISLFFGSYLMFRKDLDFRKISVIQILIVVFLTELFFFVVSETLGFERNKIWFYVFATLFIYSQYFLFFYFFERLFKNIYIKVLYPLFVFTFTILIFLLFIGSFEALHQKIINNYSAGYSISIMNIITLSLVIIWAVLAVLSLIMKRYYFFCLAFLFESAYLLSIFAPSSINQLTISIHALLIIYSPIGILLDFLSFNRYSFFRQYDADSVLNSFPFGVMIIHKNERVSANKFLMSIFNNESVAPRVWYKEHRQLLASLEYDSFTSCELSVGRREYHLYIQRVRLSNQFHKTDMFVIFNYTNIQVLEKMSKEYTNFVVTSLMDKIYQYNVQVQYNQMFEFLRGFAHNSFSMISVIKAGFEYLIDGVDSFETTLFTTKNMTKMKEQLVEKFNLMEKTLNLTNVGVAKLMDSFKILNNKIRFEFMTDATNFNVNSLVEQELFFYITNTQYKYSINIETKLNDKIREVLFNYKILSTIFHNLLGFIINEMATTHIKRIIIETYENNDNKIVLRIEGSVEDYEHRKIDDILYSSMYITDEKYASLINAFLMAKSTGSTIKRVDSQYLVFEFIINE
ncbi:MAG: hypothetical protein PHW02_05800 [bacterium]|nr:hypothetical protein [bacterium]